MVPVIRLNDTTFVDLKIISTWIGAKTSSEAIAVIVREKREALDLEQDLDDGALIVEKNTGFISHAIANPL